MESTFIESPCTEPEIVVCRSPSLSGFNVPFWKAADAFVFPSLSSLYTMPFEFMNAKFAVDAVGAHVLEISSRVFLSVTLLDPEVLLAAELLA